MALNPISDMSFNGEDWTNETLYPTYESSAEKVRDDLNRMHFILRNFLNDNIIPTLNEIITVIGQGFEFAVPEGSIYHEKLSSSANNPEHGPAVALDNMQANSVGTEQLVNKSVTGAKIADEAVQRGHLASGAVGPGNLSQGAVQETNMAQNSVNTNAIKDGVVTNVKLASGAALGNIEDGTITNAKLAGGITNAKLAGSISYDKLAGDIPASKLATGAAIGNIVDGTITNAKLAGNISYDKLASGAKSTAYSKSVATSAWSSKTATVSISGLGANDNIIVTPAPGSFYTWRDCGVYCYSQAANSITLKCETTPSASITVQVLVVR